MILLLRATLQEAMDEPSELDALVATIWGQGASDGPLDPDPELRALQNQALSVAIRLYLQSYLDDLQRPA